MSFHLVDEGAQGREDLLEGRLRLINPEEAEVDVKHLLHQWTVAVVRTQLGLQREISETKRNSHVAKFRSDII